MRRIWISFIALPLVIASGCAMEAHDVSGRLHGEVAKPGSALAYEHTIKISVAESVLRERLENVRVACSDGRFGSCTMLTFEEASGKNPTGEIVVRIVPQGVEPLVALASEGGVVGFRTTRAEDLAEAVADTGRQKEQLEGQREKLAEFKGRMDLSVSDMVTLARELASVESQLSEIARVASGQQRRIETNLLRMRYSTDGGSSSWFVVNQAAGEALDSLAKGAAQTIEALAFGLPFLIVMFPLALLWRTLWRRATRDPREATKSEAL